MNQDEDEIVVQSNFDKTILHLLGCILFVVVGYYLLNNYESFNSKRYSPLLIKFISVVCIFFFGLIGFFHFLRLIKSSSAIIINKSGLTNNTILGKGIHIPWDEIKGIKLSKVYNTKFIFIEVQNPGILIQNAWPLRRIILSLNNKHYGTPIFIATNTLAQKPESVLKILKEKKKQYV